jgi:hypothetical protein
MHQITDALDVEHLAAIDDVDAAAMRTATATNARLAAEQGQRRAEAALARTGRPVFPVLSATAITADTNATASNTVIHLLTSAPGSVVVAPDDGVVTVGSDWVEVTTTATTYRIAPVEVHVAPGPVTAGRTLARSVGDVTFVRITGPDLAPARALVDAHRPRRQPSSPAELQVLFDQAATRWSVPVALLVAQARAESGFSPEVINCTRASAAGALGVSQFMPATAAAMGVDPCNPASAINGQARMMANLVSEFRSWDLALAAYNAGPSKVRKCACVPPIAETRAYVAKVIAETGPLPTP